MSTNAQMQKLVDAADGNAMLTEQVATLREQIASVSQASHDPEGRGAALSAEFLQATSSI